MTETSDVYIGQTFNRWTILEFHGKSSRGHSYYNCQCSCGRKRPVRIDTLKRGISKSCGCHQFERFAHLYKENQQRCPVCTNWLPPEAYTKFNRGKVGEPCRECRRKRNVKSQQRLTADDKKAIYLRNTHRISLQDFYQMVARQHARCLGCQEICHPSSLVVDHDHDTGIIRGLLCSNCNTLLGMAKDREENLYRLSAYLTRDISKLLVYIIGSLRNPEVANIAKQLRDHPEFDIFDDYMAAGPEADDFWKIYETNRGRTFKEALAGRAAGHVFNYDRAYLDLADVVVVILPAGKSCMIEAGYSNARGKKVFFLLDKEHVDGRYDVMKKFADGFYTNIDDLTTALHQAKEALQIKALMSRKGPTARKRARN